MCVSAQRLHAALPNRVSGYLGARWPELRPENDAGPLSAQRMLLALDMKSRALLLAFQVAGSAVAFIPSGCASSADVHTAASPNATFERYRTFTFDRPQAASGSSTSSPPSEEVRGHIEEDVESSLKGLGYTPSIGPRGDFVVRIETGRRPLATGEASQTPPPVEQTEIPYFGFLDDERQDLVEGAFVIDTFDGQTHRLLWHGSAREVIDPSRANYDRLHRAVQKVMASFPARATAPHP